jgi:energy-coupling factor transport system permease protein
MRNTGHDPEPISLKTGSYSRLLFSVSIALAAIFSGNVPFLILLIVISMSTPLVWGKPPGDLTKVAKYAIPLTAIIFVLHLFSHSGAPLFRAWFLSATIEGVRAGIFYGLKLLVFAYSGYNIFGVIDPYDLLMPLERLARRLGPSGKLLASTALAFYLALRFIPELVERGRVTAMALKSRGIEFSGGIGGRAHFALHLIAPLIAGSIKKAVSVAMAMEIKGYSGRYHRAAFPPPRVNLGGATLSLISLGLLAAGIANL